MFRYFPLEKIINFFDPNVVYYYVNVLKFLTTNSLYLSDGILDDIRKCNSKIILDLSYEGWEETPQIVYEKIIEPYNLPIENVILLSGCTNIKEKVKEYCCLNFKNTIEAYYYGIFEKFIAGEAKKLKTSEEKSYHKKFLCFNRRWRPHRPALIGLLSIKNLLDYGYISLCDADDNYNWDKVFNEIGEINKTNYFFTNLWNTNKNHILSIPKLILDFDNLYSNPYHLTLTTNYYNKCYFTVVTETFFYQKIEKNIFFSEKTFKPIAYKHPFILCSTPNSLKTLRDFGYKTFEPFINEDYDQEKDDTIRLLKIVDEIERLCLLSEIELETFIKNITPIVEHNYKVLLSKA